MSKVATKEGWYLTGICKRFQLKNPNIINKAKEREKQITQLTKMNGGSSLG